jgi:20S proteasome subunit beta 1
MAHSDSKKSILVADDKAVRKQEQTTPLSADHQFLSMLTLKPHPNTEAVKTGTSIMAVVFDGGVVLGADSRTSSGDYVSNRASDKLSRVSDRIYCLRSGSAADTQILGDYVEYYLNLHSMELGKEPTVAVAAYLFKELIYSNKDALLASIIVGGWDKSERGSVYVVSLGGATVRQPYAISGSGSTYIYAWCDAMYKPGMTRQECQKFVSLGLSHAMARDGSSGGLIRMVTIDQTGCDRSFIPGDQLPFNGPLY